MGNKRKQNKMIKKRWVIAAAIVTAGILLAVFLLPQFLFRANIQLATTATRTATVEKGTIETTVAGSGNLAAEDSLNIRLPSGIIVESVLVEVGDTVTPGDTLATLNAASLQNAIVSAQDELEVLDSEIDDAKDDTRSDAIMSSVSGRVKQIFAVEGDNTGSIINENGSLAVVSIDGKMKVTFTPSSADRPGIGSKVEVSLPDGSTETGTVSTLSAESCTVTLTDNGPAYGDSVTISSDGMELGTGTLEINTPVTIIGGTGIIESVDVSLNESISSGDILFTLTDAAISSEYKALLAERTEYEEALRTMLNYAESNSITAESAGTISEIFVSASGDASQASSSDTQSAVSAAQAVSAIPGGVEDSIQLLSVALSGTDSMISTDSDAAADLTGEIEIFISNPATGNIPQSTIMPGSRYTGTVSWEPAGETFEANTVYAANVVLTAASGYHFASDATVNVMGAVIENLTASTEIEGNTLSFRAVFAATEAAQNTQQQEQPSSDPESAEQGSAASGMPSGSSSGSVSYSASVSGSSAVSAASSADSSGSDSEDPLLQTAFTIQTGDANSLTVNVDELDILSIAPGQEAAVVLDALPDDSFHGTVTKISTLGTTQSGVTTYPVTITLDDISGSGVLAGMNATATISIATSEDVLLIPLDALQETGSKQFVYIAMNGEEGLGERRVVETGLSDGTNVEITSGLSEGEQVAYTESSSSDESEQMMRQVMGGAMPDSASMGGMPPGGGMGGGPMG